MISIWLLKIFQLLHPFFGTHLKYIKTYAGIIPTQMGGGLSLDIFEQPVEQGLFQHTAMAQAFFSAMF